jgi:hypothetical protein
MLKALPVLLIAAITTAAVACAAGETELEYSTPVATPVGFDELRCGFYPVNGELQLEQAIDLNEQGIRASNAIQSADDPTIWFLASDIEGPGNEGIGPIAVWWMRSDDEVFIVLPIFVPVNSVAKTVSNGKNLDFSEGEHSVGTLPEGADGAAHAEECTLSELRNDPTLPVASVAFRPGRWMRQAFSGDPVLITDIDVNANRCWVLLFREIDGAFQVRGWPDDPVEPYDGFYYVGDCASLLVWDESELPPIRYESIPEQYRQLIER